MIDQKEPMTAFLPKWLEQNRIHKWPHAVKSALIYTALEYIHQDGAMTVSNAYDLFCATIARSQELDPTPLPVPSYSTFLRYVRLKQRANAWARCNYGT
ncbi:hypothetical protein [Novosphingobium terrae]|uniref:hypothetical protein n=1 Tax=Novosphingobium terrae TaxID=2726189 RepID=UPI00197FD635|nr:hypothetical protein [Novosphingobium terrae]